MPTIFSFFILYFLAGIFVESFDAFAHDAVPVNNDELGVPGFPDCIQISAGHSSFPGNVRQYNASASGEFGSRQQRSLKGMERDPAMSLECYQRKSSHTSNNKPPIRIACVGDSITAGACSSGRSHTYPSVLQTLLGEDEYAVTNLGASGSTMLKHGDRPYWNVPQFKTLMDNTWDIIIIMLGTNDSKDRGTGGPDNWPHNCTGPDALQCPFAQDYLEMIDTVRKLGPNKEEPPAIYLMIPPPVLSDNHYGMNATVINSVLPQLVPMISKWAGLWTDPVDIFSAFGGVPSVSRCSPSTVNVGHCSWWCDQQSCDQCHPNDVGYYHMANAVRQGLGLSVRKKMGNNKEQDIKL